MKPIRAVLFGVGAMNSVALRLMLAKGVTVVGAISRSPSKVGRDLGEIADLGYETGVIIDNDARRVLTSADADIVVVATSSYMTDVFDQLKTCLDLGVNVITLAEEAIHPWRTSYALTSELDRIAKANAVTVTGGGYQDAFLVNLVGLLMGTADSIQSVRGLSSFNVDEFGPEIARSYQIGSTVAEFENWLSNAERPPTFGGNDLDAIVASAGLTTLSVATTTRPEIAGSSMACSALGLDVEPGNVIGFTDVDVLTTEEGVTLSLELSGRLYKPGEADVNEWHVTGTPNLRLVNPAVDSFTTTCTQLVNRIPDVINARPGFVTVAELPPLRYRPLPLPNYVNNS